MALVKIALICVLIPMFGISLILYLGPTRPEYLEKYPKRRYDNLSHEMQQKDGLFFIGVSIFLSVASFFTIFH